MVGVAVCTVTLATVGVSVPILSLVRTLPPVVGVVVLVGVTISSSPTAVIVGVTVGGAGTTTVAVALEQLLGFSFSQMRYTMV